MLAAHWVQLASLCDRLKALPDPGGLYNQRVSTISRLSSALRAIDNVTEAKAEQKAKTNS